jgi:hypothetical protein
MATPSSVGSGFHPGELEVQHRAGVAHEAARLERMLAPANLASGGVKALPGMTFSVVTAVGADGLRWASPLGGDAGFLAPDGPTTLVVRAVPRPGDPLADLPTGQSVGLIALDFASARRVRVNGTLASAGADGLRIDAHEAFVNCPAHISPHEVGAAPGRTVARSAAALEPAQARLVASADTFFLATAHPDRGADVSHKGGTPGFVRVDADGLWWPDLPGNNMFNSFGNLLVDPSAALLFVDFATGDTLQLSGTAQVEWSAPAGSGDEEDTGRRVRFTPARVVELRRV